MKTIDAFWKDLKNDIATGRRPIYIRGYGRDDNKRKKIVKIYKKLFPKVEIRIDITNNHKPAHMLAKKSDYYKGKIKRPCPRFS